MGLYIITVVLLVIALIVIDLRRTYSFFPARELKRQAREGDRDASVLYRAVAYGGSLRILLWFIIGVSVALSFALLVQVAPAWLSAIAIALLIWYGFAWAPAGRVGRAGVAVAVAVTPVLAWILYYLQAPLDWLARFIDRHRHITFHTGLFDRDDLIDLIESQKGLPGSRISNGELDVVLHALGFGDRTAASAMVPGPQVKTVNATDALGPILMDELYDSKFTRFPVISEDGRAIVGTLYLRDIVAARQGGLVRDLMKPNVYYVHESQSLFQVLHAFVTTKHHLFVVINDNEQYVGIITIEDVLERVIGRRIEDDFDSYDDRRAVAAYPSSRGSGSGKVEAVELSE